MCFIKSCRTIYNICKNLISKLNEKENSYLGWIIANIKNNMCDKTVSYDHALYSRDCIIPTVSYIFF